MTLHPISIDSAGGEYMESVVVVEWAARPGDRVRKGELIVTVETAKAATEVEAEHDGWLAQVLFEPGQEAPVGATLGTIAESEADLAALTSEIRPDTAPVEPEAAASGRAPKLSSRVIASPLARRIALEAGLDLAGITGSGPNGRIKRRDVLATLDTLGAPQPTRKAATTAPVPASPPVPAPFVRQGGAAPLVLLHGFGADRTAWRQVLPLLPAGIETVALDLPGHGCAANEVAESVEDLALFVSDRLEEAGLENVHLAGHSLGGATALALTALGRVSVRSLTLLAPGGLGPEINGGFIRGLTQATAPRALERWLSLMVGNADILPQGYAQAVLRQMDRTGNRAALAALAERLFAESTQGFDLSAALHGLTVPTRIVWGMSDRIIPPAHAVRAPGFAAVHMLANVGHVPQMEVPALTARLIAETVLSAG